MKTAVSVPDDVYEQAEDLVRRSGRTRSELYSTALRDYLAAHDADSVTDVMDKALQEIGPDTDSFVESAARATLADTEW